MTELHELAALELAAMVRSEAVSPGELVDHFLARTDDVGAFVRHTPDRARARAATLPAGDSPLWGVPTAIKDLNLTAGVETNFGSPAYAGLVPEQSDHVAQSIEDAGLISLGKTSTPEFGSPCYTEPEGLPPAVTPHDKTRMAGGSSGGAAAAVAAGLVPLAQGSDGGGSIRIPASCCGIVGLKPSRGRISGAPAYGDPIGLGTAGSLARDVRDAAALLDVMAGHQPGDPYWAPESDNTFLSACDRAPGRLRIARFVEPAIAETTVHPECVRAYDNATELLASLGHEIVDIDAPMSPDQIGPFETCWAVLTALSPVPEGKEDLIRPLTRWLMERGYAVSGPAFGLAIGELRRVAASVLTKLAPYDAVLTPTLAELPLPVGAIRNDDDPEADFEAQKRFTPFTSVYNVTGSPAVSLPLHWTDAGLPVGVMLAARPSEDELLLSLAAQLESASR